MEKALSQAKRDQILMSAAKEDLLMKKEMMSAFAQSNKTFENTMEKMTASLSLMAEGLSDGMKMIAMAMTATSQKMQPSTHQFQPMSFQSFRSADHTGTCGTQQPGNHPYNQGHVPACSIRSGSRRLCVTDPNEEIPRVQQVIH